MGIQLPARTLTTSPAPNAVPALSPDLRRILEEIGDGPALAAFDGLVAEWPTQLVGAEDRAASVRRLCDALCGVDPRLPSARSDFDAAIRWHGARLDELLSSLRAC